MDRTISHGDNLAAMERLADGSVDLVYMDPPFNSRRQYGVHVRERSAEGDDGLDLSFDDAIAWTDASADDFAAAQRLLPSRNGAIAQALLVALEHSPIGAYLAMMATRLVHGHRVLADSGSLFLHCDPAAGHYLKILLDGIFGPDNFRNEIVWRRTHAHSSARRFAPVHDTVLFYSKTASYMWTSPTVPYSRQYIAKYFRHEDERGRYQLITCTAPGDRQGTRAHYRWRGAWPPPGRHWAWTADEMERLDAEGLLAHSAKGVPRRKHYAHDRPGVRLTDTWDDVARLDTHSRERVGFETQKPLALLERIIRSATEPGALVLDPFAGSGTTAVAAERLGRRWVVADASLGACALTLGRLRADDPSLKVRLEGFPDSVDRALRLRDRSPHVYALWGTSMMSTLHDRASSDAALATGTGRAVDRHTPIRSWVALRPLSPDALPWEANDEPVQVVLDDGNVAGFGGDRVRRVPIAACVARRARTQALLAA